MAKESGAGRGSLCGALAAALLCVGVATSAMAGDRPQWVRQLGTTETDRAYGVATDGDGNVYIAGCTAGCGDTLLAKYSAAGALLWKRRLESSGSFGVATHDDGRVYVSGGTGGSLGGPNLGNTDAYVAAYSADGALLWIKQLGTSEYDVAYGVGTDGEGNIYISGVTEGSLGGTHAGLWDAFVAKYSTNGALRWTRQFGTPKDDVAFGIATDGDGNVYTAGYGGDRREGLINKYSADGALLWTRRFESTVLTCVATDADGNVYVAGGTWVLPDGTDQSNTDVFVAKHTAGGALLWTRRLRTSGSDMARGVTTDGEGNVYLSGETEGSLGGANRRWQDAWLAKYSTDGALRWTRQLGTSKDDYSWGTATDRFGNVYIGGWTWGSLGGANRGYEDAFVAKYFTSP